MRCLLIDDEPDCNALLHLLLEQYCPDLDIVGVYDKPMEGIKAIHSLKPDLVFLDIEMPELNGFDVLERCQNLPFQVVFTTAHSEYAFKAFRYSAIDYLLKPLDREDLRAAVQKATVQKNAQHSLQQRDIFLNYMNATKPTREKIALPTQDGLVFIKVSDIVFCESTGNYSRIYSDKQAQPSLFTKSLKELEDLLTDSAFYRIHNSFLINLKQVVRYNRTDGGEIQMSNGKTVPVSRQKKQEVVEALMSL